MLEYEKIISQMTLNEKASLLSGEDFWHTRAIDRLKIPAMALSDGPHGLRKQASEGDHLGLVKGVPATCFPTAATMANSWDLALCEVVGQTLGKEAVYNNVNIILGPALNIKRSPLCGRNFEYYSEDPYLSGKLAAAYVKGIQKEGVGACLKHFAGNSQEYLRMTTDSVIDDRTLHEIYLTGFEIAVKEGKPKAVMSSYNKLNGIYTHENQFLLSDILVDKWGFDGIVVSDWGGSNDAVNAVKAGANLEMPSTGNDSILQLMDAVTDGHLDEKILDKRVDEFLRILYDTEIKSNLEVDLQEHHRLAQHAAEQAMVLLKNENILPISTSSKVAIIGDFAKIPRYQGAGSSLVNPYKLDGFMEVAGQTELNIIGYADGFNRIDGDDISDIDEAVELAKKADIVLVFMGLNEVCEMEGHDRSHLKISNNQIQLIQAVSQVAKKTVAIISAGAVIEMKWEENCDAIVHSYLSGQAGAKALLNVLTGKVNPSGKLSESYPYYYEDCPNVRYYPGKEKTCEYREGIFVGYRYFDKVEKEVRYPFGYGLSYTTFEYSNLVVEDHGIQCRVTNTGEVAGSEIIQMYINKNQTEVHRPVKELKGFTKAYIEPGETVDIVIPFDAYTFRYYDINSNEYVIEKGSYQILVGSSSRDIRLSGMIDMNGVQVNSDDSINLKQYYEGEVTDISSETFSKLYGKPLPKSLWDRSQPLEMNDSMSQMVYAKSLLARLAIKMLIRMRTRSVKKGKPDLNLFFLSNMSFRAIAKMSDGAFSMEMVEKMLIIINGRFFRGLGGLIKAFFKYKKRGKVNA